MPCGVQMSSDRQVVLHVTEVTGGGVADAITQYTRNLSDVDHVILAPSDSGVAATGVEFVPFEKVGMGRRGELERVARRVKPTVIHAHSSWAGARVRTTRLGIPVAYQPHAFAFAGYASSPLVRGGYRLAEAVLARRTASFLTLSTHESALARSLSSSVPIAQVVNSSGIDAGMQQTWKRPRRLTVVMCGRIAAQKDPDFFIDFGNHLRRLMPEINLTWIGDGESTLRQRLVRAGVEVTGWLAHREVADRLAQASLYVHSARYEGFPLSVLDAAAVGMPVVLRRTASTEGIELPQADSTEALARLSVSVLSGDELGPALRMSQLLHRRHSVERQRESLLLAYEIARGMKPTGAQ